MRVAKGVGSRLALSRIIRTPLGCRWSRSGQTLMWTRHSSLDPSPVQWARRRFPLIDNVMSCRNGCVYKPAHERQAA